MHAIDYLDSPEKHKIGPVAVVYGKERFLKLEAIQQIAAAVLGFALMASPSPGFTTFFTKR